MDKHETILGEAQLRLELARLQRASRTAGYLVRLCGVQFARYGFDADAVAHCLGVSERSLRRWLDAFDAEGLDGLRGFGVRGRPGALAPAQLAGLREVLARPPREAGYPERNWSSPLLGRHIRATLGLELSARQCRRLLCHFLDEQAAEAPATTTEG